MQLVHLFISNQAPSTDAAGSSDQNDSNEKGGDDVIDADFTETKD